MNAVFRAAWPLALLVTSALLLVVLLIVWRKRRRIAPERPLGAFGGLRDQVARAAETGSPVHIALGTGGMDAGDAMVSLGGLRIAAALADVVVSYGASLTVSVGEPTLLPLAQDALRRAYERQGISGRYDPAQVRFVAPSRSAFAAGTGYTAKSDGTTVVVIAGSYGAEITLISDAVARRSVPQFVAVTSTAAIGAMYPATDRLAPGEALFAAAAQQSGDAQWFAGLLAQDMLRVLVVAAILVAALWALLGG